MATTITNYEGVQDLLNTFVTANGVNPAGAPHGVFWATLTYNEFITQDVPNIPGFKILEVGSSATSNIILALSGAAGTIFAPGGGIGQMPRPSPPYNSNTPTQTELIAQLAAWIDAKCPNKSSTGKAARHRVSKK